ncbi:MAG: hypothetical protein J6Z27_01445, partial [Bacteroidales bacterium]|nr:hypothetical protein [Bacteroidales bacterium]
MLPLKLRGAVTYSVPEAFAELVREGSWVVVPLRGRSYYAVVEKIGGLDKAVDPASVLDIESVVPSLPGLS